MHNIEPYFGWLDIYECKDDPNNPLQEAEHSEFQYSQLVYNYYIHPLWDNIGSDTLYAKVLYAEYEEHKAAIIEFIGEWNDALYNDIMILKRGLIDTLIHNGIEKFVLIMENVLNYHYSDNCYYEEWQDDIGDGWICMIQAADHVIKEMDKAKIYNFVMYGETYNALHWRKLQPNHVIGFIDKIRSNFLR